MVDKNKINVRIEVDSKKLKSGMAEAGKQIKNTMEKINNESGNITPVLDLSKFDVSKIQAVLEKLKVNIDFKAQTPESMQEIEKTVKAYQNLQKALEKERKTLAGLKAEYRSVAQAEGLDSSSAKKLSKAIEQQKVAVMGAVSSFKGLRRSLLQYGTVVDAVNRKNRNLSQSLKNVSQSSSSIKSMIVTVASLKKQMAGLAAAMGAGFAVKSIIELNSKLEQSKIGLENLMGSSVLAEQHLKELADFAAKTPFDFQELVEGSKRLQAFGIASQKVIPVMSALGNAVSAAGGDTETLNRAMLAVGQIQTKNRVQAEELLQLAEAGIPVYQILADKLGLTADQVADIGNQGVNASKAIQALTEGLNEKFGGAMEAQAKSFSGLLNNLQDEIKYFATAVGESGFAEIKEQLEALLGLIEEAKENGNLDEWAERIGTALASVLECLGELFNLFIAFGEAVNLPEVLASCVEKLTDLFNFLSEVIYELEKMAALFKDSDFVESFGHAIDFIYSKLAELNPVVIQLKSLKDILQRINGTARETDGFSRIARDLNKVEEAIKKSNLEGVTEDNIKALARVGVTVRESADSWIYSWKIAGRDIQRTVSKSNNGLAESMETTSQRVNDALNKTGDIKGLEKLGVWIEKSKEKSGELVLMWQENGEILKKTVKKADLEILKERYAAQIEQNKKLEDLRNEALKKEAETLKKRKDLHKKISDEIAEINMSPIEKELNEVSKKAEEYRKAGAAEVDIAQYTAAKKAKIYEESAKEIKAVNDDLQDKILNLNGKELESKLFNLKKEMLELKKKGANEISLARYVADSKKRIAEEAVRSQYGAEYDAVLEAIKSGGDIEEAYQKAHEEATKLKEQEKQALQYVQEQTGLFAGAMQKLVTDYKVSTDGGLSIVQEEKMVELKGKIDQIFSSVGSNMTLNLADLGQEGVAAANSYFAPFKQQAEQIKQSLASVNAVSSQIKAMPAQKAAGQVVNHNQFEITVNMDAKI
ncbi:MAG: tape measure protein, partial [bacterium]